MTQLSVQKSLGAILIAMALLAGCEREGPAERAGETIDDAARDTGEYLDDAGNTIRDCTDDPDNC